MGIVLHFHGRKKSIGARGCNNDNAGGQFHLIKSWADQPEAGMTHLVGCLISV
jgi:hypothetical protein